MAVIEREQIGAPVARRVAPPAPPDGDHFGVMIERGAKGKAAAKRETEVPPEERISFREWALKIPTAKGQMLDFRRFPYQVEFYDVLGDLDIKEVDAQKGVQIGASEAMTRLGLYLPDVCQLTALYVFPALKQMYDFSDARVNPLRENSEYLQSRTPTKPGPWNKGLKRIGNNLVYYRGSESKRDLIAVDADAVLMDEYDILHPPNIPEAENRIAGSLVGLTRRIGVPTDPDWGIARRYQQSDQRTWQVKCTRCREGWQPLDFWKNVVWEEDEDGLIFDQAVVCRKCRKPLDVLKGKWVAKFTDGRRSPGFHIHRLMVAGERNLRTVIEHSKARDPVLVKSFWTNDLGLPYADEAGGLSRKDIATALTAGTTFARTQLDQEWLLAQNKEGGYRGTGLVTAGIDVASTRALNVRISLHVDPLYDPNHRKIALFIGTCDSFKEVGALMERFNVNYAVVDHLPEGRLARGLAYRFHGRIYVGNYAKQKAVLVVDTENLTVSAQRVAAMDATKSVMQGQRNLLPQNVPPEYVEQMVTPRRKVEKDEYDKVVVSWESRGPDDYFQAETYDILATEVAKVRMEVEDQTREEQYQLDDVMPFERSKVADLDDMTWSPGPGESDETDFEYRPGMSIPGWDDED